MSQEFDAVVIGAGVSGLYSLYRLRELGLKTRVFEAGAGVGGTWYWNCYPGARFDSESYTYQYSFSPELIEEWGWSEQFAGQPEIERYLNHVADKFKLRPDIEFNARVQAVTYDEASKLWTIETEDGKQARARYVLAASGLLSAFQLPKYAGVGTFEGLSLHTARWPKEGADFRGKRVGIIGSGPTAVQIIQTIAPDVGHLTVFQRTANWCTPLRNRPIEAERQRGLKDNALDIIKACNQTFGGFIHDLDMQAGIEIPKAARWARYQELYDVGGFALWLGNYHDVFTSREIADDVSEFLATKIRERVKDPAVADRLTPKNHPFGTKRPPGEKNYYEVFNRDNVELVDLRATPIAAITPSGVRTQDQDYPLDVLIYATGFQSLTGELLRMGIRGKDGLSLEDKWSDGPKTNLGIQFAGFPNFFAIMGPHNPATFCNITRCAESNVDWIVGCIRHLRERGYNSIETTHAAEDAWTEHCYESAKHLLMSQMRDSWFFGNNNRDGGTGKFLMYGNGVPAYRKIFAEVVEQGYAGFQLS